MIATIAAIAEKKKVQRSVAIIWKPLFSERSDRCDNDRWDRPQFYLNNRSDHCHHMETTLQRLQRFCDEKCTRMQSLFVPGPVGYFFNSLAVVAIIWKLVVVRIAQHFCSDRSHHLGTSPEWLPVREVIAYERTDQRRSNFWFWIQG